MLQIVAFVKGTRTQPQCGFSYKVLSTLNELRVNYEVLNVLDELYNPGLREAIKDYSQWPTIPQVPFGCLTKASMPHTCVVFEPPYKVQVTVNKQDSFCSKKSSYLL